MDWLSFIPQWMVLTVVCFAIGLPVGIFLRHFNAGARDRLHAGMLCGAALAVVSLTLYFWAVAVDTRHLGMARSGDIVLTVRGVWAVGGALLNAMLVAAVCAGGGLLIFGALGELILSARKARE